MFKSSAFSGILLLALVVQALGADWTQDWELIGNDGRRVIDSQTGETLLSLQGHGDGEAVYWKKNMIFSPGTVYQLTVKLALSPGSSADAVLVGTDFMNSDIKADSVWKEQVIHFTAPHDGRQHFLRLGLWRAFGECRFSKVELCAVTPVPQTREDLSLGQGESLDDQGYHVFYLFDNISSNTVNSLEAFDAAFNTNRWDLYSGKFLTLRHQCGRLRQLAGTIALHVIYYEAGRLDVEASNNGRVWKRVGECASIGRFSWKLPDALFPAVGIWIRISARQNSRLQFNEYAYDSDIQGKFPHFSGQTLLLHDQTISPGLQLSWEKEDKDVYLHLSLSDSVAAEKNMTVRLFGRQTETREVSLTPGNEKRLKIDARQLNDLRQMSIGHKQNMGSIIHHQVFTDSPILDDDQFGYYIDTVGDVDLWWCEGTHKVGRFRQPPAPASRREMEIWLAKNEYEPIQLILRSRRNHGACRVTCGLFQRKDGSKLPLNNIKLYQVDYVRVKAPTDKLGSLGWWPDPLPALESSFKLQESHNYPIWLLAYIPPSSPAGDYRGNIQIEIDGQVIQVPLMLHVWDFTLPNETHLKTAFGLYASLIQRYHHFANQDRLDEVLELYLQDFARHRISPFDPLVLHPVKTKFDPETLTAQIDFSVFDAGYERYVRGYGFNSFRFTLEGIGWSSVFSHQPRTLAGYSSDSKEYDRLFSSYCSQVGEHLSHLGALSQAYLYWFDEPEPKDYPYIRQVMTKIHQAAPQLRRMLTEQPEVELYGAVDIWCPILDRFQPEVAVQRQQLGESLWWYICTNPKEPYVGMFIDHSAVELRTWIWQTWQHHVDGILIWAANYWTSPVAFPAPLLQNPYLDPMSYRSGQGTSHGEISYWGNGDGRLIYPPKAVFENNIKCIQAPVSSFRWEMLREGLEDYEYLWMVQYLVRQVEAQKGHSKLIQEAKALLIVPEDISRSLIDFNKSPQPIYLRRKELAEMIIHLQKILQ
ncbi:MAG: DUF4091 domain-containing protein [Calditrichaeota bacterium]|nr:MAG: DUF4091 domain-containing protein [Calditrichota bacterium]